MTKREKQKTLDAFGNFGDCLFRLLAMVLLSVVDFVRRPSASPKKGKKRKKSQSAHTVPDPKASEPISQPSKEMHDNCTEIGSTAVQLNETRCKVGTDRAQLGALNQKEAAEFLGVDLRRFRKLQREGVVPKPVRGEDGRSKYYKVADLISINIATFKPSPQFVSNPTSDEEFEELRKTSDLEMSDEMWERLREVRGGRPR